MDPNKQNQSVDGMKPVDGPPMPPSSVDGVSPSANNGVNIQVQDDIGHSTPLDELAAQEAEKDAAKQAASQQQPSEAPVPESEIVKLREKNKHLKVWLFVLSLLFVAGVVAAVVTYVQRTNSQSELDAKNRQISELQSQNQQQQQSATQQQIDKLTAENKQLQTENTTLKSQVATQQKYIEQLFKVATDLKTKCGSACASTTVPAPPTTSTSTTGTNSTSAPSTTSPSNTTR